MECGETSDFPVSYFFNPEYPSTYDGGGGGGKCILYSKAYHKEICQLRIDFLSLSLAPPNGDGYCRLDALTIKGTARGTRIPQLCGENSGQHIYVDYDGKQPIILTFQTADSYVFKRRWQLQLTQIPCHSKKRAPSGCLQHYKSSSGTVQSFNYNSAASAMMNSIGFSGTRHLANLNYKICIEQHLDKCGITWSQVGSDPYSFTMTDDSLAVDSTLLGTMHVQSQNCRSDYVSIPSPEQSGNKLIGDRFCGLGLVPTISFSKPFGLMVVTDGDELSDMGNRGFYLEFTQKECPVLSS